MPIAKRGNPSATRIEYRSPDPACNPYLAFAVMLAAGLRGVTRATSCRPRPTANLFEMSGRASSRSSASSSCRSRSRDALRVMEQSTLVHEALGEHIFEWFLRNKRSEWRAYKTQVSAFEHDRYLRVAVARP